MKHRCRVSFLSHLQAVAVGRWSHLKAFVFSCDTIKRHFGIFSWFLEKSSKTFRMLWVTRMMRGPLSRRGNSWEASGWLLTEIMSPETPSLVQNLGIFSCQCKNCLNLWRIFMILFEPNLMTAARSKIFIDWERAPEDGGFAPHSIQRSQSQRPQGVR